MWAALRQKNSQILFLNIFNNSWSVMKFFTKRLMNTLISQIGVINEAGNKPTKRYRLIKMQNLQARDRLLCAGSLLCVLNLVPLTNHAWPGLNFILLNRQLIFLWLFIFNWNHRGWLAHIRGNLCLDGSTGYFTQSLSHLTWIFRL